MTESLILNDQQIELYKTLVKSNDYKVTIVRKVRWRYWGQSMDSWVNTIGVADIELHITRDTDGIPYIYLTNGNQTRMEGWVFPLHCTDIYDLVISNKYKAQNGFAKFARSKL